MNKPTSLRPGGSLLERAMGIYGLPAELRVPQIDTREPTEESAAEPAEADADASRLDLGAFACVQADESNAPAIVEAPAPRPFPLGARRQRVSIDREALAAKGFIPPAAPAGALAEEFRIIKRQLLLGFAPGSGRGQVVLVASAQPGEGKSFCALNLALSMAGEKDLEVLLVDGDVAKAELPALLGTDGGPGLVDAIIDRGSDPEDYVVETDIPGFLLLPAGRKAADVTEFLASARTSEILALLTERHPNRIVIFDSPPTLVASPASVLASHAGQVMMVVRADTTTESDLREALSLLTACDNISLVLNGTRLLGGGSRFGSYYGYGP